MLRALYLSAWVSQTGTPTSTSTLAPTLAPTSSPTLAPTVADAVADIHNMSSPTPTLAESTSCEGVRDLAAARTWSTLMSNEEEVFTLAELEIWDTADIDCTATRRWGRTSALHPSVCVFVGCCCT